MQAQRPPIFEVAMNSARVIFSHDNGHFVIAETADGQQVFVSRRCWYGRARFPLPIGTTIFLGTIKRPMGKFKKDFRPAAMSASVDSSLAATSVPEGTVE